MFSLMLTNTNLLETKEELNIGVTPLLSVPRCTQYYPALLQRNLLIEVMIAQFCTLGAIELIVLCQPRCC